MRTKQTWNPELYEARHSFVWQSGEAVVDLLNPKPGEHILDLGCGPGQLTNMIAERGAITVGLDVSPEMIGQARQNYPALKFILGDAVAMKFAGEFDAVFSNAALHWMTDAKPVLTAVRCALKSGGRFVAEMGGHGNISRIERALTEALRQFGVDPPPTNKLFPTVAEYASLLEEAGLEVRFVELFDRPTLLEGHDGMANWLRQFSSYELQAVPREQREQVVRAVSASLEPELLKDGRWFADYRRLRFEAVKSKS